MVIRTEIISFGYDDAEPKQALSYWNKASEKYVQSERLDKLRKYELKVREGEKNALIVIMG